MSALLHFFGGGGGGGSNHVNTITGRWRIEKGRPRDDAGYMTVRGVSEFSFVHLTRIGNRGERDRRIARDVRLGRRNFAIVFGRCQNLFDLHHNQPEFWEASDETIHVCNDAGMRVLYSFGQDMKGMSWDEFQAFVLTGVQRWRDWPGVTFRLVNEPGLVNQALVSGADDRKLLDLADRVADVLGHQDFLIGDIGDEDAMDAQPSIIKRYLEIARHTNCLSNHPSRKGDDQFDADRFRRWIDHLEGRSDIVGACRAVNPNVWMWLEEPFGFGEDRIVDGHIRERDPEVAVAAEATALIAEMGYTFHYISEKSDGPAIDACLARVGPVTERFPADPSYTYHNDSWSGSPTRGFGPGGKVRSRVNGHDGVTLADGTARPSPNWANGYRPVDTLDEGTHEIVWRVSQ
jgi:hypothetical protein